MSSLNRCSHAQMSDFKSRGQWVCSGCGKTSAWGDSWGYYGAIGCRKCGQEPIIEYVACSDACMALHAQGKRVDARSRLEAEAKRIEKELELWNMRRQRVAQRLAKAEGKGE